MHLADLWIHHYTIFVLLKLTITIFSQMKQYLSD